MASVSIDFKYGNALNPCEMRGKTEENFSFAIESVKIACWCNRRNPSDGNAEDLDILISDPVCKVNESDGRSAESNKIALRKIIINYQNS